MLPTLTLASNEVPLDRRWSLDAPSVVVRGPEREFSGVQALADGGVILITDQGELEVWRDGTLRRAQRFAGQPDFEDLALDPRGDAVWIALEDTCELWRVALDGLALTGRWSTSARIPRTARGVEALAFVPLPAGGHEVWLGHQGTKSIFVMRAPGTAPGELEFVRELPLGVEPRALAFDSETDSVLAACSDGPTLRRISRAGLTLEELPFSLAPHTVEGLALGAAGTLLACADGGDVVSFSPRPPQVGALGGWTLVERGTLDVPSNAPEIVAVSADRRLVLASDSSSRSLEIFSLTSLETQPSLTTVDGAQRRTFEHEPTSVAAHPSEPLAFVTVIGAKSSERGTLHAVDLRAGSVGRELWSCEVGRHPDNVAISADGRWIVVANEGEGDDRAEVAPGTISVLDTRAAALFEAQPKLAHTELDPARVLGVDAGVVEPEFVAFDPRSRFAVVTCQENDAAVVVALSGPRPELTPLRIELPSGAQPDGVAVLDDYVDPQLGRGALIAFAEEGDEQRDGRWPSQGLSLTWLGPEPRFDNARALGRIDVVKLLAIADGRAHPEGVAFVRRGPSVLCALGVERANRVLLFDVTDPRAPRSLASARVGSRPEGLCTLHSGPRTWFVTGDEGKNGPGEISFVELVARP